MKLVELAIGGKGGCARSDEGHVYCWGANDDGRIGDGTTDPRPTPVRVSIEHAVQLVAGWTFACARIADRTVWCWGANDLGLLGDGSESRSSATPVQVRGVTDAIDLSVSAVGRLVCATLADHTLACWGNVASDGTLSSGALRNATPVRLRGTTDVAEFNHACVRHLDGTVTCWGHNGEWKVAGLAHAAKLANIELGVLCSIQEDGTSACWGSNANCRLGLPSDDGFHREVAPIKGVRDVVQVYGTAPTCVVTKSGAVYCQGQGADERAACTGGPPHEHPSRAGIAHVFAGTDAQCASLIDGRFVCYPEGDESRPTPPVQVGALRDVISYQHEGGLSCALVTDGSLWCWGDNDAGQLGNGTTTRSETPVRVVP